MSKFFGAHSDSESSSSSSESDGGHQLTTVQPSAFMFSDDEEDTRRVVRSAREKRYEQLTNIIKNIRNSKKIKDFNKMESSFLELSKAFDKAKPVIDKEEKGVTPRFYVRILVEMEDLINETWEDKEGKKSMNKYNAKSLGALRQRLRKYIRTYFEEDVTKFRENPDAADDEEDQIGADATSRRDIGSDGEDDEDAVTDADSDMEEVKPVKVKQPKKPLLEDDVSDDSYWDTDSDESSMSSSDEERDANWAKKMFLKSTKDDGEGGKAATTVVKKSVKKKGHSSRSKAPKTDGYDDDGQWVTVERGVADKPKMFEKDAEIDHDLVIKKLHEIMAARGKRRTNRKEQIQLLCELRDVAKEHNLGIGIFVKIQFAIVAAIYDNNAKVSVALKPEYWEMCLPAMDELLTLITDNSDILVTSDNIGDDQESLEEPPYKVRGCFLSNMERVSEEFIKVLKGCDAHSNEYVDRLKDEPKVIELLEKAQKLIEKFGSSSEICRIYLKIIEHVYFKFDSKVMLQKKGELPPKEESSLQLMDRLCKYIYAKDSTDRLRTRAILCHIYHRAIHDLWFEARDLMLMSHLQDTIMHSDPLTQILYNRTMVQLGLCGFRHAEIKEAHNALLDIQLGGRSKELLAQGLLPQRNHERSSDQEKLEKQRQMPFHMHINLEMLECVYLVSAMIIEIPYMAAHEFDARRRMISKSYYQQLRSSERQSLVGPPESMREHVVAASKAMRNGDWKKCRDLIINDKMNARVWDLFCEADKVRSMLGRKIQEETLRTYLFTYSKVFDSISVVTLSEMFNLEKGAVHAIVSKMIINEELMASLDEPSECMVMHRTEPSRLQSLSLQLSDKIAQLVDNNERLLELRPCSWQAQWRNKDGDRQRDGGGGNFRRDQRDGGGVNFRRDQRDGGGGNFRREQRDGGNFRRDQRDGGGGNFRRDQRGDGGGKFGERRFGNDRDRRGGGGVWKNRGNRD